MNNKRINILSIIVIGYMLLALFWWAVLLMKYNDRIFALEKQVLTQQLGMDNPQLIAETPEYKSIIRRHERKRAMVIQEGIVFGLTIALGIFITLRSLRGELAIARRQRNFLLSITHELKSPLTSINLILDTFVKRELPRDKVIELAEGGISESKRLNELFDKILFSTKLEKSYDFILEEVDLSELVEQSLAIFSLKYDDVHITKDVEPMVMAEVDTEAFSSVLHNLYENAYKYSKDTKKLHVALQAQKQKILLSIADAGIGIPVGERQNIFKQFYRMGSEDTRQTQGTGLGLYIVKQIVKGHKGKIHATDNEWGGTTFEIILPKRQYHENTARRR